MRKIGSLEEALYLLDKKSDDSFASIQVKMRQALLATEEKVVQIMKNFESKSRSKNASMQETGIDLTKKLVSKVDELSHQKPWVVIGIVALLSGLLGFLLGRISKNGNRD